MKKLLSGLIIVLMVSLLGHSFNAEAASYEKIIYDKAVNLKGVVNQSKRIEVIGFLTLTTNPITLGKNAIPPVLQMKK